MILYGTLEGYKTLPDDESVDELSYGDESENKDGDQDEDRSTTTVVNQHEDV